MDFLDLAIPILMTAGVGVGTLTLIMNKKSKSSEKERTFPTSANPTLNKIYDSFESIKNGEYEERKTSSMKYGFRVDKYSMSFHLFENRNFTSVFISVEGDTVFYLNLDNKTHEIRELENKKDALSLEESSAFVQAFYDFYWMIKKNESEKINTDKAIEDCVKTASKQMRLQKKVNTHVLSQVKEMIPLSCDQEIADYLEKLNHTFSYIGGHVNVLEIEQQHTYERISTVILPNVLSSFFAFSESEQKEHKDDLINALMDISKEAESIESVIKHVKKLDFQKNIALIKQ